jgi:hypothetical protein
MAFKQSAIIIDDFTSQSVQLYDNVTFYDYGSQYLAREWDWDWVYDEDYQIVYDGFGEADYTEFVLSSNGDGYFQVEYDSDEQWRLGIDLDLTARSGYSIAPYGTGIAPDGYAANWVDYDLFLASDTGSDIDVGHGDWVLSAFQSQLDDPASVEAILIDVDTLENGAIVASQYRDLYSLTDLKRLAVT